MALLSALFRVDMDKPYARARLMYLSTILNRFDNLRAIIFPDKNNAAARDRAIPDWLAEYRWSDDQKHLKLEDFKGLMRFVLSNDRQDLLREFIARENMAKFWLDIQTLRELYSQIPKGSMFGFLLFKERKRQLLIYKAYLKSNKEKATQMAAWLGLQLLYPAAYPDLESSVVRSVSSTILSYNNTLYLYVCTVLYMYSKLYSIN